jgi:anthranilate synthase component 1
VRLGATAPDREEFAASGRRRPSSRSSAGCWPTARPRSASTASSPGGGRARSCWSPPSRASSGRAGRSSGCAPPACSPSRTAGRSGSVTGCRRRPRTRSRRCARRWSCCAPRSGRTTRRSPGGWSATSATTSCAGIERLPSTAPDELGMPELALMLVTDLAVLDHGDGTVLLIATSCRRLYDDAVRPARRRWQRRWPSRPRHRCSTVDLDARPRCGGAPRRRTTRRRSRPARSTSGR